MTPPIRWALCGLVTALSPGHPEFPPAAVPSPPATLAFASRRDGNWEVYLARAPEFRPVRLTTRPMQDRFPLWSPDGALLAFGSQVNGDHWELWLMSRDGSDPRLLSPSVVAKGGRGWSPDGREIVLESRRAGNVEVLVVRADGSGERNLTQHEAEDRDPAWSPDGRTIAFRSDRGGDADVYLMARDGGDVRRLTDTPGVDGSRRGRPMESGSPSCARPRAIATSA